MTLHYFVEGENERKLIETIKNKYLHSKKEIDFYKKRNYNWMSKKIVI